MHVSRFVLLHVICAAILTAGVCSKKIFAFGNKADDQSNITWAPLGPGKVHTFPDTGKGGVLWGLYKMTNLFIYIVNPWPLDYGR